MRIVLAVPGGSTGDAMTTSSVKIVVLGECGVGKSAFVSSVCGKPNLSCPSTIGVSVSIAWHIYRAGTTAEQPVMVELWDVGGTAAHRSASSVFIEGSSAAILVHDLTNSKSESNLAPWLRLLDGRPPGHGGNELVTDLESCPIPVLIVGTKADLAPQRAKLSTSGDRLNVDCRREIPAGSTASMTLARFFEAAIDRVKTPVGMDRRRRVIV